jgi:hypothetical protein
MPSIADSGAVAMNSRHMRVVTVLPLVAGIALAMRYRDWFDVAAFERWIEGAGIGGPCRS